MGRAIERIALQRGHEIVARIDRDNLADIDSEAFRSADVAIEFTTPATAVANYLACFDRGIKVVSGTTGWLDSRSRVDEAMAVKGGTLFWSSNFSLGVNIFMAVNRRLAALMDPFGQYKPWLTEVHHIHKLDHPSGTAITLAEGIADECSRIEGWTENPAECADRLLINHVRQDEVPGIHTITWESDVDTITISHSARSRDGFALGAVIAAEWTASRTGALGMDQLMADLVG